MKITIMSVEDYDVERKKQEAADFKAKTEGTYCGEIPETYGNAVGGSRGDYKKPSLQTPE